MAGVVPVQRVLMKGKQPMMETKQILTRKQLAKKLQISMRKIARLEEEGLPTMHLATNLPRYDYTEVVEWLKKKT